MRGLYRTDRHDTLPVFYNSYYLLIFYLSLYYPQLQSSPIQQPSNNYNNCLKNFYIKCYNPIEKKLPNAFSKINTYYKFLNKILTKEKIYDII